MAILQELQEAYPMQVDFKQDINESPGGALARNLHYLAEHGLVEAKLEPFSDDMTRYAWARATLTAKGIDFLADDGGLTAILSVVTVRLHEDTIRALLIQKVSEAPGEPTAKEKLMAQVKGLPAEALKSISLKAMEAGLAHAPNLLHLIQSWIQ